MTQPKANSFLDELKRRKVVRVALVYAAVAWGAAQVGDVALSTFEAPQWVMQSVIVLLGLGFPVAVALAWAFDVTAGGVRRTPDAGAGGHPESGRKPGGDASHDVASAPQGSWLSPRSVAVILCFAVVGLAGWFVGRSSAGRAGSDAASIAVLPFADLSGDGSGRTFTEGLHDDLLTQLSRIAALRVTSRTSVQEYRDSEKPIPTIARELGVTAVLEGGVQRAGERLRINVQLIDGASDRHVWAETYDSDLSVSNVFDIQSRIAAAIAIALRAELTQEERTTIAEQPTENFEAYEAYLAGLAAGFWDTTDTAALRFERATDLDPQFAEAWAAASRARAWQFRVHVEEITAAARRHEVRARAEQALERARALAPDSREVRLAEGFFQYYVRWDFDAAARAFDGLVADYPQDGEMYMAAALIDRRQGRWDRSLERMRTASRLDPRNPEFAQNLAWTLLNLRGSAEAERAARLALASDPERPRLNEGMADILAARGAPVAQLEPYWERTGNDISILVGQRVMAGAPDLAAYYRQVSAFPAERWLIPGERQWSLALLAEAAGIPARTARADSAIALLGALDGIEVDPEAPFAERRAPASGYARRGLCLAIVGRRAEAEADLRRSRALWRRGEDHADEFEIALTRAHAWAVLGNADEFFAELTPYARIPSLLHARRLADDPILSRFAADPRYGELVRALQSPLAAGR